MYKLRDVLSNRKYKRNRGQDQTEAKKTDFEFNDS